MLHLRLQEVDKLRLVCPVPEVVASAFTTACSSLACAPPSAMLGAAGAAAERPEVVDDWLIRTHAEEAAGAATDGAAAPLARRGSRTAGAAAPLAPTPRLLKLPLTPCIISHRNYYLHMRQNEFIKNCRRYFVRGRKLAGAARAN